MITHSMYEEFMYQFYFSKIYRSSQLCIRCRWWNQRSADYENFIEEFLDSLFLVGLGVINTYPVSRSFIRSLGHWAYLLLVHARCWTMKVGSQS